MSPVRAEPHVAESAIVHFSDPESYADGFGDSRMKLTITAGGAFSARLTRLRLNDLNIYRCRETLPRIAFISLPPKMICLTFPIGAGSSLISDGLALRGGDIVLHVRGDRTYQRSNGARQWGLISISTEQFAHRCKALTGKSIVAPEVTRVVRPERPESLRFQHLFREACLVAETKYRFTEQPEVARTLEQQLFHAIIDCVSADQTRQRRQRHATVMVRFEEALSQHIGHKLSLPMLCAEIGVPERTLRMCCTNFLAVSPLRYLMLQRLNQARAELRRARPSSTSVAEVARNHQFLELGRFAVIYRAIFGESPSATLHQNPQTSPNLPKAHSAT